MITLNMILFFIRRVIFEEHPICECIQAFIINLNSFYVFIVNEVEIHDKLHHLEEEINPSLN